MKHAFLDKPLIAVNNWSSSSFLSSGWLLFLLSVVHIATGVTSGIMEINYITNLLYVLFGFILFVVGFMALKFRYQSNIGVGFITLYLPKLGANKYYLSVERIVLKILSIVICLYFYFWFAASFAVAVVIPVLNVVGK